MRKIRVSCLWCDPYQEHRITTTVQVSDKTSQSLSEHACCGMGGLKLARSPCTEKQHMWEKAKLFFWQANTLHFIYSVKRVSVLSLGSAACKPWVLHWRRRGGNENSANWAHVYLLAAALTFFSSSFTVSVILWFSFSCNVIMKRSNQSKPCFPEADFPSRARSLCCAHKAGQALTLDRELQGLCCPFLWPFEPDLAWTVLQTWGTSKERGQTSWQPLKYSIVLHKDGLLPTLGPANYGRRQEKSEEQP